MLVTLHDLIASARHDRYGLGAFNTYNLEITAAIIVTSQQKYRVLAFVLRTKRSSIHTAKTRVASSQILLRMIAAIKRDALSMAGSSLLVAVNALLLKWTRLPGLRRPAPGGARSARRSEQTAHAAEEE